MHPLQKESILTYEQLIEDTRELASFIESIHPEPYGERGGKIAYNQLKNLESVSQRIGFPGEINFGSSSLSAL